MMIVPARRGLLRIVLVALAALTVAAATVIATRSATPTRAALTARAAASPAVRPGLAADRSELAAVRRVERDVAAAGLRADPHLTALRTRLIQEVIVGYARAQLGTPYVWGGTGTTGFDCSGLSMMAYRSAGISIPRLADAQYLDEPKVRAGHEAPGDLVFFGGADGTVGDPGHVGIVVDPARHLMIAAPTTGEVVKVQDYTLVGQADGLAGFARPVSPVSGSGSRSGS